MWYRTHWSDPCFIAHQWFKCEIYYTFILLVSSHHPLMNNVCYTFIPLVLSPCGLKNKILTLFIQQKITLFLCAPEKIQATCPISILGNLTQVSGDIAPRHLTTYSVPFINAEKSNRPLSRRLLIKLIATNYHKNWQKFKDG